MSEQREVKSMRVLFLDIDGVLNSHAYFTMRDKNDLSRTPEEHARAMIDPAAVEHLNAILDGSGAQIVVSSSWRIAYSMGEIKRALCANGFRHPRSIIGKTPGGGGERRGLQIDAWLKECTTPVETFVILDDDSDMEMHAGRLVQTDYQRGLTAAHVAAALAHLTGPEQPREDKGG